MKIRKIAYSGLLIAIGLLLPQLFHFSGLPDAGKIFLPMHIAILLAGFIVGPVWGLGVAVITPILSSLITGMPPVPLLYFMLFELATYAVVAGICANKLKLNAYVSLILAMICGRAVYALALLFAGVLLGLPKVPPVAAVWTAIVTGIPGIAIQIVFIPAIVYALKRGGLTLANTKKSNC